MHITLSTYQFHKCLPVYETHILQTIHLIGFTLGKWVVKGPGRRRVDFGAIKSNIESKIFIADKPGRDEHRVF